MKTNVHFTTCHHKSVKCRPRTNDYGITGFNITPWTTQEKLDIAKTSIESLIEFADGPINIIDDGANILEAVNWLLELDQRTNLFVRIYEHKGSSSGINNYFNNALPKDTDLVAHFEDDHIFFNPEGLDWKKVCYEFLKENKDVGVITFRSGLPSDPINHPDYNGAWGPIGFREGKYPAILYNNMGNAHHIMLMETYSRFFPLQGNAGSCEAYMNGRLNNMKLLNAEIQIPVYAFHSHCYSRALPEVVTTDALNMSPRGIEYGIKEMYEHIRAKLPIEYSYYKSKEEKVIKCYP